MTKVWCGEPPARVRVALLAGLSGLSGCDRGPASVPAEVAAPVEVAAPRPWRHLRMSDLSVDVERFEPLRARYLQVIYDMDGREEVRTRTVVHIDLDRAVHSGPWDGSLPPAVEPLREPGLVVDWQVQNSVYNAFDRILTDGHLSVVQRVMPGGGAEGLAGHGMLVGFTLAGQHTRLSVAPVDPPAPVEMLRVPMPDGSVNILTIPYVLAAMDPSPGERFTLPGFDLGVPPGRFWRGAFEVVSRSERELKGRTVPVLDIRFTALPDSVTLTEETIALASRGRRITRLLVSPDPPYLLGRADLLGFDGGDLRLVRESLRLVDWAPQPLPGADLTELEMWNFDPSNPGIELAEHRVPDVLVSVDDH